MPATDTTRPISTIVIAFPSVYILYTIYYTMLYYTSIWKLGSIDSLLNRSHKTGTIFPQPGSGRPRLSRSSEGPCVQSGGHAKKASVSSLDFAWNCHSPLKCIQKNNWPWSPAHMLQVMSCLAVVWRQSYIPSHSLINNIIVCNKSCYYYKP